MLHTHDLPGLKHARELLSGPTSTSDDAIDDVLDGVDLYDPGLGKRPAPNTPDAALDALHALRLGPLQTDGEGLVPAPGAITVLRAAHPYERERLEELIDRSEANPDTVVRLQPKPDAGGLEREQFRRQVRKSLLKGARVVIIADVSSPLPDDLSTAVERDIRCPEVTGGMIAAILSILHDRAVAAPPAPLPALEELQLAAIFAIPTPEAALATLERVRSRQEPRDLITLENVHGQAEVVEAFDQLVDDLDAWRADELEWREVTTSVLLTGPPGVGKTHLAQAVAGSAGVPLVKTGYAECQKAGHQGDMLRALYAAADQAISQAPAVFFLDEIDSFYSRARSTNGYITGVVNGLLTLLDRLNATPGMIVIAATNFAENVDSAVIRSGRFDRHVTVGPLDRAGVRSMLSAELPPHLATDAILDRFGDQLTGVTGAQLSSILREAATRARRARSDLAEAHLAQAAAAVARPLDRDLLVRTAFHEAGHLLLGHLLGLPAADTARITSKGGEVLRPMPRVLTRGTVEALLTMHMAGRAAEHVALGEISNGAGGGPQSDLALATDLALRAEVEYGLGHDLIWQPAETAHRLMPDYLRRRVGERLHRAERAAQRDLEVHRLDLDRIAQALLDKRELSRDDLRSLLDPVRLSKKTAKEASRPVETAS
jgi:ATP-dependent Zn protease